tara:strand:- start:1415 stop:1822 length:408 start_codon:yes stop_codon:yes gene_type:complete
MAAIDAQGVTITYENNLSAAQTVGGVVSFSGLDGEAADIDITNLASTAKEFKQGLQDFGNFSMEVIRDYDDAGQAALLDAMDNQATREMVVTLPSGTLNVITFQAYVKSVTLEGAVDDIVRGTINLKISGEPVAS